MGSRKMLFAAAVVMATIAAGCNEKTDMKWPAPVSLGSVTAPGLSALAGLQGAKGSFSSDVLSAEVGVTALSGLAFLASGDSLEANPYRANIEKATAYLLSVQDGKGMYGGEKGNMYGHGFAMLYVSQVFALSPEGTGKKQLEASLARAVALAENAQNKDGGWRYTSEPLDADVSVTAGQLKALVAAREAGIKVNPAIIDHAVRYVKSLQTDDGGFQYTAGGGGSGWARSAAAVATLLYSGVKDDKSVKAGMEYLKKQEKDESPNRTGHYYYGNYYLAQALNLEPKDPQLSYGELVKSVMNRQDTKTGLWHGDVGDAYATATALIVLELPEGKLPAFGKGK